MRWRTLDGQAPRVIAHRGASGLRPEHTLGAYELALAQGADIVEPDLVPSADGVLFARHDPGLARSTDIARRAEFADQREGGDWPCHHFLAEEIDGLGAIQPFAGRSPEFDGRWSPLRWNAVIEWAREQARARGERVLLYPELKHPARFAGDGVDPVLAFIDSVFELPPEVEVWVQCFDLEALRRVHEGTGLKCCLGLDLDSDWRQAMAEHRSWLGGFVAAKGLLLEEVEGEGSPLVHAAHAAGMRVDAWTFRDDRVGPGHASIEAELEWALQTGADALFCDFPATALQVRAKLAVAA
jgi:glycerophosphoryl diester phosphodiesterase